MKIQVNAENEDGIRYSYETEVRDGVLVETQKGKIFIEGVAYEPLPLYAAAHLASFKITGARWKFKEPSPYPVQCECCMARDEQPSADNESKPTPRILHVFDFVNGVFGIFDQNDNAIVEPSSGILTREDAVRLAACWNACEGIETESLESVQWQIESLKQERDASFASEQDMQKKSSAMMDDICRMTSNVERLFRIIKAEGYTPSLQMEADLAAVKARIANGY